MVILRGVGPGFSSVVLTEARVFGREADYSQGFGSSDFLFFTTRIAFAQTGREPTEALRMLDGED